jgi:predicted ester cyclase
MTAEENKALVRRLLEEGFSKGNTDVVDEVLDPNFVCYDPNSEAGEVRGAQTIKAEIEWFRNALPDLTYTVEDQITEGDKVATRYKVSGTHQGEFFGVPPTGERVQMTGIMIDCFEGGKMVEEWPEYDLLGVMRQLGAVPAPG